MRNSLIQKIFDDVSPYLSSIKTDSNSMLYLECYFPNNYSFKIDEKINIVVSKKMLNASVVELSSNSENIDYIIHYLKENLKINEKREKAEQKLLEIKQKKQKALELSFDKLKNKTLGINQNDEFIELSNVEPLHILEEPVNHQTEIINHVEYGDNMIDDDYYKNSPIHTKKRNIQLDDKFAKLGISVDFDDEDEE